MKKWKVTTRLLQSEPLRRCTLDNCKAACCLYGVWVDKKERTRIIKNWALIRPFMRTEIQDVRFCFTEEWDEDYFTPSHEVVQTRIIDDPDHYGGTACIFLRSDHKCALQVAAQAKGLHPWFFKPFYCILHPLDLDELGNITLDKTKEMMAEPGSCLRHAEKDIPLLETFEPELRYFLGDSEFEQLETKTGLKS